jgi:hypothetical protein
MQVGTENFFDNKMSKFHIYRFSVNICRFFDKCLLFIDMACCTLFPKNWEIKQFLGILHLAV